MNRNIIRYIVMAFALCVFGYAAYELTLIRLESAQAQDIKNEISNLFMQEVDNSEQGETETNAEGQVISMNNTGSGVKFVYDYNLLLSYNSSALGYIRQDEGDYIDNPILIHTDNEYYLHHLPNHVKSSVGSIYVDYHIEDGLNAKNPIVYGHCMGTRVNNIMFGSLPWYITKSGYSNEHPTMDIYIGDKHYKYYVFACYYTQSVGSDTYQYQFASDESFMEYVAKCKEKSVKDFPEAGEITAEDYIITLSTCTLDSDESRRTIIQLVGREEIDDNAENTDNPEK